MERCKRSPIELSTLYIVICVLFLTFCPNEVHASPFTSQLTRRQSVPLQIMPIGDSITFGVGASDNSSYRYDLEALLVDEGYSVHYLGDHHDNDADWTDNLNVGWGGYRINGILQDMQQDSVLEQNPNLILIHAGTNDNWYETTGETYAAAPDRLGRLLDYVLCNCPDAVVLVAMLISNKVNQTQTDYFNSAVPDLVLDRFYKGYKISVVDQRAIGGDDMIDLLHPNDSGYELMAENWLGAILNLPDGWITNVGAAKSSVTGSLANQYTVQVCEEQQTYFLPWLNGNQIATGVHVDGDAGAPPSGPPQTFSPGFQQGVLVGFGVSQDGLYTEFADLDGDKRADYLWTNSTTGAMSAWLNGGQATWNAVNNGQPIVLGVPGGTGGISPQFADLNGDGKAEYIFIGPGCNVVVYENGGPNGNIWNWAQIDVPLPVPGPGSLDNGYCESYNYIWGDLNGDGKADVAIIKTSGQQYSSGPIDVYIQQGTLGTSSFSWELCANKGISPGTKLVYADLDGDGRADSLAIDENGGVTAYLNKAGSGDCDFSWAEVGGQDSVAIGVAQQPEQIHLADYDADGKVDYLNVSLDGGAVTYWKNIGQSHAPEGTGIGGYGAAVRLADIDGDGRDDYISVSDSGEALCYLNGGLNSNNDGWIWTPAGNGNGIIAIGVGAQRHQIQFADLNGDGLADYLVLDDTTGSIHCYLNGGIDTWIDKGVVAIGAGQDGAIGVRLADFDGDGKADYIYLDPNGVASVWINAGGPDDLESWTPLNNGAPVAIGVGAAREDVAFADVDGDGRADYLWIHPDTGATQVWYNGSPNGSVWISGGQIADGVGYAGQDIRFARMGNTGRADYVAIDESTGALHAWANECLKPSGTRTVDTDGGSCGAAPFPTSPPPSPKPPAPSAAWTHLDKFTECGTGAGSKKQQILDAWVSMSRMAYIVCGDDNDHCAINWFEDVTVDFFGPHGLHTGAEEANLFAFIYQYTTYLLGNARWSYFLDISCSDNVVIPPGNAPCPPGTARGDEFKCNSYCYSAVLNPDGSLKEWATGAIALAGQPLEGDGTKLGYFTFCPGFFSLPTCSDTYDRLTTNPTYASLNLENWDCRERVIIHEISHLNQFSDQGYVGHVSDRKIKLQNRQTGEDVWLTCYGAYLSRLLARWTKQGVGTATQTNADNLSWYFLAKWIKLKGFQYPKNPVPTGAPLDIQGSSVGFTDIASLADAMGVSADLLTTQLVQGVNPTANCSSMYYDQSGAFSCDDDYNDPVELDGTRTE